MLSDERDRTIIAGVDYILEHELPGLPDPAPARYVVLNRLGPLQDRSMGKVRAVLLDVRMERRQSCGGVVTEARFPYAANYRHARLGHRATLSQSPSPRCLDRVPRDSVPRRRATTCVPYPDGYRVDVGDARSAA
jgi:hypothetical protein